MEILTLSKYLDDVSLFSAIDSVKPFPFIGGDAEDLDLILSISYGKRPLFTAYESLTVNKTAKLLVKQHSEAWESYIKAEALKENLNVRRELTETTNENQNRLNNREDVNKVSAYNTEDFINNDGSNSESTDEMQGETVRELVDENVNPQMVYNMLSSTARDSILKRVMQDISGSLTLSIY